LQQRYGAALQDVDANVAAMVTGFAGSADELLKFIDTIFVAKDALDAINTAVPGLTISLGAILGGTDEQRNALSTLAATFKLTTSDYVQAARDALAASKLTLSENLTNQSTKVAGLALALDGSLASAQALAQAEATRLQMVAALIVQIGQISAEVGQMFSQSAENFRLATFSAPQKQNYFDTKAAETLALLKEATDPTRIRELAAAYNSYLNSSFGLLDDKQKVAAGGEYANKADAANVVSQQRLDAAAATAEKEARALSTNIEGSIKSAMQVVATAMQAAANTMQTAANTPTTVVVTGKVVVEIDTPHHEATMVEVGLAGVSG
jgi:uncharacterized protein YqgV (UPF0045/DUF77 family)